MIVKVLANPGRTLAATTHGSCEVVDGNRVQYTPNAGFDGQDSCKYEVCVSGSCDIAMVYVEVGTPSLPVANDDGVDTSFETPVTFAVIANDAQGESLTLDVRNITTQAANGICSVVIGTPSNVKYTPNADFSGRDSCVYTTCVIGSSTACDTATLTIDVAAAPTSNPTQSPSNQVRSYCLHVIRISFTFTYRQLTHLISHFTLSTEAYLEPKPFAFKQPDYKLTVCIANKECKIK